MEQAGLTPTGRLGCRGDGQPGEDAATCSMRSSAVLGIAAQPRRRPGQPRKFRPHRRRGDGDAVVPRQSAAHQQPAQVREILELAA